MSDTPIGTVVALWRYPVKSMMGEELNSADVTERGLLGDRAFALLDASDGKVASAKNPRKWGKLFDFRASLSEPPRLGEALPPVRITFPDGTIMTSDDRGIEEALSHASGRQVSLASSAPERATLEEYWPDIEGLSHREAVTDEPMAFAAPGTFFDATPVHLLTTATLDRLRQVYPQGRFDVRRFRPNIVVKPDAEAIGFVENDWVGRTLTLGDEARLSVSIPCPRCVMTTLAQGDLPSDPGILRAAAQHNRVRIPVLDQEMPSVGVYAVVSHGGLIRRGDPVRLVD